MPASLLRFAFLVCLLASSSYPLRAQTTGVVISDDPAATPDASAIVDVKLKPTSAQKGFLTPRMTQAQRDAIATPATALLIYQTDNTPGFYYYNGSAWVASSGGASTLQAVYNAGNTINGTNTLSLSTANGMVANGTVGTGAYPSFNTAAGTSALVWYPAKAAFRVGGVDGGTQWGDVSIGNYSFASGYQTTASGFFSTAMGLTTTASAYYSTAMGNATTASGMYSTAMGRSTTASGDNSIAIGYSSTASGVYSIATGYSTTASGDYSTAIGTRVSSNGKPGALVLGDASATPMVSSTANEFSARFAGGYRFFTNPGSTIGIMLAAGGNAWSTISDSSKKELYRPAQPENFLASLHAFKLGSWNYQGRNPRYERHYGPMAQEFYQHFGHDAIGAIGCDTLINSADMDGVLMIMAQGLERRTVTLRVQLEALQAENQALKTRLSALEKNAIATQATETPAAAEAAVLQRISALEARLNVISSSSTQAK